MGVHYQRPSTERFPIMGHLRFANGAAAVGLDGNWERGGCTQGHLLHAQNFDVLAELRARRLGYT